MCDVRVIVTSYFFFSCVIACFGVIIRNYTFCWAILQRQTFILLCVHTSHIAHRTSLIHNTILRSSFLFAVVVERTRWCIWQLDSSHLHTQTHTHKEYCHIIWLRRIKQHKKRLNINKQKWESKKTEWKKIDDYDYNNKAREMNVDEKERFAFFFVRNWTCLIIILDAHDDKMTIVMRCIAPLFVTIQAKQILCKQIRSIPISTIS